MTPEEQAEFVARSFHDQFVKVQTEAGEAPESFESWDEMASDDKAQFIAICKGLLDNGTIECNARVNDHYDHVHVGDAGGVVSG